MTSPYTGILIQAHISVSSQPRINSIDRFDPSCGLEKRLAYMISLRRWISLGISMVDKDRFAAGGDAGLDVAPSVSDEK